MAITTAEFQTTLADPRRVRLVGRPDAAPPTPPTTAPPSRRFEPDDWGADHDPFQLGALLESEEDLLEGSPSEAPTSTSGPVPGDSGPDIYPAPSTGRPSRLWLLPLGASLAVLAMVVALGGPAPELEVDVLVVPNDSASDAPEASEEPKRTGTLTIESSPWAYVSIDGVLREWITPTRLELPSGPHVIGFFHPASDWRTERKVTIRPGEELTLNVTR